MIEACTKRGAGFFPVTTTYSDHDVTVLSTFKFTAMVKFRCATIIILGQVLQASTRSTPASDLFRRYMMSSSSLPMSNPDLISWTQSRLGALYETREGEAFANAFDAVFSPSCEVRVNHTPSTLDVFKSSVLSRMAASAGVALSWENMITTGNRTDEPSVVSGTLIITRNLKFRIRAAPAQCQTHINFSAKVEDCGVQEDEYDDHRRITSLYHTSVDKKMPIHFATPHPVG